MTVRLDKHLADGLQKAVDEAIVPKSKASFINEAIYLMLKKDKIIK